MADTLLDKLTAMVEMNRLLSKYNTKTVHKIFKQQIRAARKRDRARNHSQLVHDVFRIEPATLNIATISVLAACSVSLIIILLIIFEVI